MTSKLLYLLIDWETTTSKHPTLEQVRFVVMVFKAFTRERFAKIASLI